MQKVEALGSVLPHDKQEQTIQDLTSEVDLNDDNPIEQQNLFQTEPNGKNQFGNTIVNRDDSKSPTERLRDANQYYHEVAYKVDLKCMTIASNLSIIDLYKTMETCYYNQNHDYIPVFMELGVKAMITENNKCKYVIQVWDKSKNIHFQQSLQLPIERWQNCKSHCLYTLKGDKHSTLYIIDYQTQSLKKLRNLSIHSRDLLFMCLNGTYLALATERQIVIYWFGQIRSLENFDTSGDVDCSKIKYQTIETKQRVLALLNMKKQDAQNYEEEQTLVIFETKEFKLDFNIFQLSEYPNDETTDYFVQFRQASQVTPRDMSDGKYTKIKKLCYKIVEETLFAITLSESNKADLYAKMSHKQHIDRTIYDTEMSMLSFFMKLQDSDQAKEDALMEAAPAFEKEQYFQNRELLYEHKYIKHNGQDNFSFESSWDVYDNKFHLGQVQDKILQDYVDIFQSFLVDTKGDETICLVAHGKFISAYDLLKNRYLDRHLVLPGEIDILFHSDRYEYHYYHTRNLAVLLKNSDVYYNLKEKFYSSEEASFSKDEETKGVEWDSFGFSYTNTMYFDDPNTDDDSWLLAYDSTQIKVLHRQTIYHKTLLPASTISSLARYFSFGDTGMKKGHEFVINTEGKHILCLLKRPEQSSQNEKCIQKRRFLYELEDYYENNIDANYVIYFHSHPNNYIALNKTSISINNVQDPSKSKDFQGYMVASFNFITESVNYALCREYQDSCAHGLMLIDFNQLLNEQKVAVTELNDNDVALDPQLTQFNSLERIGFMNSVNQFVLIPYLHQDRIVLMGYDDSDDKSKILSAQVGQYYCHLRQDMTISSWTIYNGKLFEKKKLHMPLDLSSYEMQDGVQKGIATLSKQENFPHDNVDKKLALFFPDNLMEVRENHQKTKTQLMVDGIKQWVALKFIDYDKIDYITFVFPKFENSSMFFSQNFEYLLLKFEEKIIIYKAKRDKFKDESMVQWEPVRTFDDYPLYIDFQDKDMPHPHVLSPDFKYYLKYKKDLAVFTINFVETGDLVVEINEKILEAKEMKYTKGEACRFAWVSNSAFKVMHDGGTEIVYEIDPLRSRIQEISYNVWPLFHEQFIQDMFNREDTPFYSLIEKAFHEDENQIQNLKIRYQKYKSDHYLQKYSPDLKYQMIHSKCSQDSYVYQSFTYLHWTLVEDISLGIIEVQDLAESTLEGMVYNIFPGGDTFMHILSSQIKSVKSFYDRCHDPENGIKIHIPYLPNHDNETFISKVYAGGKESTERKTVFTILKYLKLYGVDHHSRCLQEFYDEIIATKNQVALDYLESRFIQTDELAELNQGRIQGNKRIISTPKLHQEQYEKYEQGKNTADHKMIKLEILDIPHVYHYLDPNFKKIFSELSTHESYEFFNNKAIQILIDLNYPLVRNALLQRLIAPFAIFHILYVCYTNIVYEHRNDDDHYKVANFVIGIIILCFSAYFLGNEVRQVWSLRLSYFTSFWNYIDILAPCFVIVQQALQFAEINEVRDIDDTVNRVFLSLATLLMWAKFLSIFRVFDSTNYLIRTIYEVIYDMGIFLFVLLITVAGFGDSFLRLSLGNEEENQFTTSFVPAVLYAYSMILGGYDTEAFGDVAVGLVWILWILCTIFDMIVMLNLLIAIISETFGKVNENQTGASYQEKACIIAENGYLIPYKQRQYYAPRGQFIIVGQDIEKDNNVVDETEKRFNELNEICSNIKAMIKENNQKQLEKEQARDKRQEEVNQQILKRIGEIKLSMLKQARTQKEEIEMDQHKNKLTKMLLAEVQELHPEEYQFWNCAAKKFEGCKKQYDENLDKQKEIVYHCDLCNFDFCADCNKFYPDAHKHDLEKLTFAELAIKNPLYETGWHCNGEYFETCYRSPDLDNGDIYEELYHDRELQYDFCLECGDKFKKEADDDYGQENDDDEEDEHEEQVQPEANDQLPEEPHQQEEGKIQSSK